MSTKKLQSKKEEFLLIEEANSVIEETLDLYVHNSNRHTTEAMKARILVKYLSNPDNIISCPEAGPDVWLRDFHTFKADPERFECSNGNVFYWCSIMNQVIKAEINGHKVSYMQLQFLRKYLPINKEACQESEEL